ncbi:MAG: DUF3078 domain-containing protein [Cyclobacteriaceae bacterium]|nr:DUF3078 domain-containing protein [Cyclobacteriaceae bacterium]
MNLNLRKNNSLIKKRILLIICFCPVLLKAQNSDTTYWKVGGVTSLAFSQVSLTNWVAGGNNSVAFNSYFNLFADYAKDRSIWENSIEFGYGLIKQADADFQKSDDKINLTTKYGRTLSPDSKKWYWSMSFNLRTQFANGFSQEDSTTPISTFMAPGYMVIAAGLDYKPSKFFSLSYAPVTGKVTVVNDDVLSAAGAFGVDPGSKSRSELGSYLTMQFKKDLMENVNLESRFQLFSNYANNPKKIDLNWENALLMKINKYLSASLINQLIYDADIDITTYDENGNIDQVGPKVQFKNIFGVGLVYIFRAKK